MSRIGSLTLLVLMILGSPGAWGQIEHVWPFHFVAEITTHPGFEPVGPITECSGDTVWLYHVTISPVAYWAVAVRDSVPLKLPWFAVLVEGDVSTFYAHGTHEEVPEGLRSVLADQRPYDRERFLITDLCDTLPMKE